MPTLWDGFSKPPLDYHINWGHPISRGIVGCWLFNESGGSTVYDQIRNRNGTLTNHVSWVPGNHGTALSFDGTDDYIPIATTLYLLSYTDWSISAWFKAPSGTTLRPIYIESNTGGGSSRLGLRITTAHKLQLTVQLMASPWYVNIVSTQDVDDGKWHHGVGYNQGNDYYLYVDGVQAATLNTSAATYTANKINIGRDETSGASNYYTGEIGSVILHNRALTSGEILGEYLFPYSFISPLKFKRFKVPTEAETITIDKWFNQQIVPRDRVPEVVSY